MTETINGEVLPAGVYTLDFSSGQLKRLYPPGARILSENPAFGLIIFSEDSAEFIHSDGSVEPIYGLSDLA